MNLSHPSAQRFDHHIADDAEAETVGDRIGKRHHRHRQEGGHGLVDVGPFEIAQRTAHERADDDERRGGGHGGHGGEERRHEERQQKEEAGGRRRQAGASAFFDTGRRLDITGHRAGAEQRAGHRAESVGGESAIGAL